MLSGSSYSPPKKNRYFKPRSAEGFCFLTIGGKKIIDAQHNIWSYLEVTAPPSSNLKKYGTIWSYLKRDGAVWSCMELSSYLELIWS